MRLGSQAASFLGGEEVGARRKAVGVVKIWAVFVHPKMEVCSGQADGQAGKQVQSSGDKI